MFPKLLKTERKLVHGVVVDVHVYTPGFVRYAWWGTEPSVYPSTLKERISYFHEPEGFDDLEEGVKLEAARRYHLLVNEGGVQS